jgi:hypothetical protein
LSEGRLSGKNWGGVKREISSALSIFDVWENFKKMVGD